MAILTEEDNQPIEVIKNASEKRDGFVKPFSGEKAIIENEKEADDSNATAGTVAVITCADILVNEKISSKVTMVSASFT